jgi:hypothetical protein
VYVFTINLCVCVYYKPLCICLHHNFLYVFTTNLFVCVDLKSLCTFLLQIFVYVFSANICVCYTCTCVYESYDVNTYTKVYSKHIHNGLKQTHTQRYEINTYTKVWNIYVCNTHSCMHLLQICIHVFNLYLTMCY